MYIIESKRKRNKQENKKRSICEMILKIDIVNCRLLPFTSKDAKDGCNSFFLRLFSDTKNKVWNASASQN